MRRVVIVTIVALGCGIAFWSFADPSLITATLDGLSVEIVLALLALLGVNELVKGLRWAWYLRAAQLPIRVVDGLTSYLASQAACSLPGGALLSARLAEEHGGGRIRLRHTTPPLLVQGFGDLFAVSLLALGGIVLTGQASYQLAAPAAGGAIVLLFVTGARSDRFGTALTGLLERSRYTRRLVPAERDARMTLATLCTPRALAPGVLASLVSSLVIAAILVVLAEALTLRGLHLHEAIYVHGMTMLAHFLVPIPNGFGTNELSVIGLLNIVGIGFGRATAIAVTYRAFGLAFRTVIGLAVLLIRYHRILFALRRPMLPQTPPALQLELAAERRE
ncbi:lysylphosphatidylglycerol synthase transmembrane domain-containing protein [Thermomicrobium sp. 4228-Ro]|uniref:lysylphosphatidylglycerol synthase transmembrane domain-containing protein n=1 Tax=Thermomicrobium sp. 4228-Ro TaxID=2993937 RepID=UPI0022488135|nr:lysylphosphatidylglycerol synthase transmembrane domain-containing protein [Thermomicrobium sp. 4228-Ro]MCX2726393.1 lysylphosphatidylglycerol synthase transmembrane domain-containing protein [Thermomicrobium sp. 4228-Ro]